MTTTKIHITHLRNANYPRWQYRQQRLEWALISRSLATEPALNILQLTHRLWHSITWVVGHVFCHLYPQLNHLIAFTNPGGMGG